MILLKIVNIEAIPLSYPLSKKEQYGSARGLVQARQSTLIKLTCASGTVGFGEAFGSPKTIVTIVEDIRNYFLERNVSEVPNLSHRLFNMFYHTSSKGYLVCAISGIEIAAWDAFGKILGVPVYQLLGGLARKKFMLYGSTGYITAEQPLQTLIKQAHEVNDLGLGAVKIKIGTDPEIDLERVKTVRNICGDIKLMVDINGNYTADVAIAALAKLEPYDLYWVEEPVPPYDFDGFRKIKRTYPSLCLAAGEAEYTRYGFKDLMQAHVDLLQPDLIKCGGIYEAKAIAMMAQAYNIRISPHIWGGIVGRAAAIQLMASIPFYPHSLAEPEPMFFEYDLGSNGLRDDIGTISCTVEDGWLEVNEAHGLGVELDLEKVNHYRMDRQVNVK